MCSGFPGQVRQTFTYDPIDRLLTSTSSGYASTTYAYDVHGNRQTAAGTTYTYQTGSLRMTQQGTNTFGYDSNGNLTSVTGTPSAKRSPKCSRTRRSSCALLRSAAFLIATHKSTMVGSARR